MPPNSILLFILLNCFPISHGFFLDYPLKSSKGSLSILSTLTDKSTQATWIVKETFYVTPIVHGKIEITHGNDKMNVFYHDNDDRTRLVFYGNECYEVKYTSNGWSGTIPTIDGPLLNMAVLMGPSLYLRLVDQLNTFTAEDNIYLRGSTMKNLVTHIGADLRISFVFPASLNDYIGIRQPKRLVLTGEIPGSNGQSETVLYDIYQETVISPTFDTTLATPILGIGCPRYFELNQPFPEIDAKRYHIKLIETIATSRPLKSIYSEFSIDSRNKITRVTSIDRYNSKELEQSIIFYKLGIKYIYSVSTGTCYVVPISTDDDPSLDDNLMKMNPITLDIKDFKYVGQVKFDHRSGLVDVWESTEFNVTVGDILYGKVVSTQFMAKQFNGTDYLPVAAQRKFYKIHLSKFVLSESRERDFYDYDPFNYENENDYRQSFQLSDCYNSPDDRMYLTLQISSEDLNYKQNLDNAADNLYSLKETIKQIIASNLDLSYLRITSIDIEFESIYIVVRVEIVREPDLLSAMDKLEMKFDRQSFDDYFKVSIQDPVECLKVQASNNKIKFAISCMGLDSLCVSVKKDQSMPKSVESGSYCTVYVNRDDKLRSLVKEVTLKQLSERFTKLNGIKFSLSCDNCPTKSSFSIVNVFQDSSSLDTKETRMLFRDVENGVNLGDQSELVVGVKNFGDCYRACAESKNYSCETFSFCATFDPSYPLECRISNNTYGFLVNGETTLNVSCNIYGKNNLLDYHRIRSTKFIEVKRSQSGLTVRTADECARACVQSKERCYSFQICDSHYCSFAQHYTSSNTIPDDFCDIYIPKRIHDYVKNNHRVVTPIVHSEIDLTLDQCASLCSGMRQSDDQSLNCHSFNYCPKGEATSVCQLTNETVSSASQVTTSDDCSNYEDLKTTKQSNAQQVYQLQPEKVESNTGGGVIVFFVFVGLALGMVTPWAHDQTKKRFRRYIEQGLSSAASYDNIRDSTL